MWMPLLDALNTQFVFVLPKFCISNPCSDWQLTTHSISYISMIRQSLGIPWNTAF